MPCYYPLRGWYEPFPGPSGKRRIVFTKRDDESVRQVEVPCGQCIGCRLERSRKWAARCMHEASLYSENCFITMTYSDDFLPERGLDKSAFPKFMKRLRKQSGKGPRYFHCGEYGDKLGRPHYHALLFNYDFQDKVIWKVVNDVPIFTSAFLSRLWPFGFCTIGAVTFESAAYVARYALKKITGPGSQSHYERFDPLTGEIYELPKEYVTMSRRPGIGRDWYNSFSSDVYPDDFLVSRGFKMKPPRYYDSLYELTNEGDMASIRERRAALGYEQRDNSTLARLKVREIVARAKLSNFKRSLDDEA